MMLLGDNIMMLVGKAGVEIALEDSKQHRQIVDNACSGDYGYLLDRRNDYSVKHETYVHLNNNPRLKCIAVISYRRNTVINFSLEKRFIRKPFELFDSLEAAKEWLQQQLSQ